MGRYTYLVVDCAAVVVPFLAGFHPRLQFHKTWYAFWPACLFTAAHFIAWDALYTQWQVWGFNPRYITGVHFLTLPVEEILFFICIPYASLFTYHCLRILRTQPDKNTGHATQSGSLKSLLPALLPALLLALLLFAVALISFPRLYTTVTFAFTAAYLLWLWMRRVPWLGDFFRAYAVILVPFFIVNGILTGSMLDQPVVWYNPAQMMGPRLATIPVEDVFYGMLLLLMITDLYERLIARRLRQRTVAGSR